MNRTKQLSDHPELASEPDRQEIRTVLFAQGLTRHGGEMQFDRWYPSENEHGRWLEHWAKDEPDDPSGGKGVVVTLSWPTALSWAEEVQEQAEIRAEVESETS